MINLSKSKAKYQSLLLAALFCLGANTAIAQSAVPAEEFSASDSAASQSKPAVRKRPKIGLALGGGGARGAAHVGVLKTLIQEGVPIDMIAGTSIGSVVGGLYGSGLSPEVMEQKFCSAEMMNEFTNVPIVVRIVLAPIIVLPRFFGYHPYDGLYKGVKFRNYINTLVPQQCQSIESMKMPFAAVVTNVVNGKSEKITHGNIGTAVQASTAVPGLRKPVEIDQQLFCDGGLINNLPVNHVRDLGADFVIAVNIDEPLRDVPLKTFRKMGSMSQQALRLQLFAQDDAQGKTADVVIHPDTGGIGLISRKSNDAKVGIEAGQQAARAAMPEIRAKLSALGIDLDANRGMKQAGR